MIAYPLTSRPASKQILLFTEEPITSAKNENLSSVLDELNQNTERVPFVMLFAA